MNFLVDPTIVTKFDRTDAELELYWLFCQVVAGKTARVQAKSLEKFMLMGTSGTPFQRLAEMVNTGTLLDNLKESRLGQYTRLTKGFTESLSLNLRTAEVVDLVAITGVGDKTARYFLLHTRPSLDIAVLDRHVLKHLRSLGHAAPVGTPSGKKYLELEQIFLAEAKKADMTPADFDLMLWNQYSKVVKV